MQAELSTLETIDTWNFFDLTDIVKLIGCRRTYKVKHHADVVQLKDIRQDL